MIGLAMAMTTIRFLDIFDIVTRRQIEAMEHERVLADERERIARELHDGAIQKVYTAGLLVRSAEKLAEKDTPLVGRLATAVGVLDDAIGDLRQNLSQLQAPAQASKPLKLAIQKLATDARFSTLVTIDLDLAISFDIENIQRPDRGQGHCQADHSPDELGREEQVAGESVGI